jgi:hypothetical protein
VTTSVYLPNDSMALTLNGTTKWASAKELQRLRETRMGGIPAGVQEILERIKAAIEGPQRNCAPRLKRTPNSPRSAIACSSNGSMVSRFRVRWPEQSLRSSNPRFHRKPIAEGWRRTISPWGKAGFFLSLVIAVAKRSAVQ